MRKDLTTDAFSFFLSAGEAIFSLEYPFSLSGFQFAFSLIGFQFECL